MRNRSHRKSWRVHEERRWRKKIQKQQHQTHTTARTRRRRINKINVRCFFCVRIWFHWIFGFVLGNLIEPLVNQQIWILNLLIRERVTQRQQQQPQQNKNWLTIDSLNWNYEPSETPAKTKLERFFFRSCGCVCPNFAIQKGSKIDTWLMLPHLFSTKMKEKYEKNNDSTRERIEKIGKWREHRNRANIAYDRFLPSICRFGNCWVQFIVHGRLFYTVHFVLLCAVSVCGGQCLVITDNWYDN